MSTAGLPHASASAAWAARYAPPPGAHGVRGHRRPPAAPSPGPPTAHATARCDASAARALVRVVAGGHPHAHLRPCGREERVGRRVDRRGVDADDRDRGARPQPLGEAAGADQLHPVQQPRVGPQLAPRPGRAGPPSPRTRPATATSPCSSCRVASSRHSAVSASGTGAAVHPAVHAVAERPHLHGDVGTPAQRGRQRRHLAPSSSPSRRAPPHRPGSGRRSAARNRASRRRADLLLAFDEHGHPDGERGRRAPAAPPGAPRCPPCRRRRRGRTAARAARPARTGRCPRPRGRRRLHVVVGVQQHRGCAGRRRAAVPSTAGWPPSTVSTSTSGRPASRSKAATSPALARRCAAAAGSADTDGIRTSRSRPARTDGRTRRTADASWRVPRWSGP